MSNAIEKLNEQLNEQLNELGAIEARFRYLIPGRSLGITRRGSSIMLVVYGTDGRPTHEFIGEPNHVERFARAMGLVTE
jgi:hypothetical protein